ncbi:MAG: ABC transporter permease subunit [Dehalococcoidia bacterium]|nr:ABC transporter permease subunit [Dehalococcoidia bacterium]
MIGVILALTLNQLVRQRRTLLLLLLAAIPVLVSLLFRFTAENADAESFTGGMMSNFIANLVLPLTALVVGTAALGQEIEDGTTIYLLAKPLARWKVVVAKIGAAWIVTASLVVLAVLGSGFAALSGDDDRQIVFAFAVAVVFGSLAYAALFVSLSIRFGRALIIGLAYVFIWEAVVSQFISGVRFLSIRAYTIGIADTMTEASGAIDATGLGPTASVVLLAVVVVAAFVYAVRRLQTFELGDRA